MPNAKLWFDGACDLKTKRGQYGFHIVNDAVSLHNKMSYTRTGSIACGPSGEGDCTNNIAEYTALIEGLRECSSRGFDTVEVFGDSQLVICQMKGEYKVKNANLKPLFVSATVLVRSFFGVTFTWIPRTENTIADGLSHASPDETKASTVTSYRTPDGPGETSYRTMWNTMKDEYSERVELEKLKGEQQLSRAETILDRMKEIEESTVIKKKRLI